MNQNFTTTYPVTPGQLVIRPWGSYIELDNKDNYKLKILQILPGQAISLQSHSKRRENWTIIRGTPLIHVGGSDFYPSKSDINAGFASYFIDIDVVHRIINIGKDDIVIVETQHGVCEEEDITRFEDMYNRMPTSLSGR